MSCVGCGPNASESLTLADLSPKHAHCAVPHTASRPPAAASGAVASACREWQRAGAQPCKEECRLHLHRLRTDGLLPVTAGGTASAAAISGVDLPHHIVPSSGPASSLERTTDSASQICCADSGSSCIALRSTLLVSSRKAAPSILQEAKASRTAAGKPCRSQERRSSNLPQTSQPERAMQARRAQQSRGRQCSQRKTRSAPESSASASGAIRTNSTSAGPCSAERMRQIDRGPSHSADGTRE